MPRPIVYTEMIRANDTMRIQRMDPAPALKRKERQLYKKCVYFLVTDREDF